MAPDAMVAIKSWQPWSSNPPSTSQSFPSQSPLSSTPRIRYISNSQTRDHDLLSSTEASTRTAMKRRPTSAKTAWLAAMVRAVTRGVEVWKALHADAAAMAVCHRLAALEWMPCGRVTLSLKIFDTTLSSWLAIGRSSSCCSNSTTAAACVRGGLADPSSVAERAASLRVNEPFTLRYGVAVCDPRRKWLLSSDSRRINPGVAPPPPSFPNCASLPPDSFRRYPLPSDSLRIDRTSRADEVQCLVLRSGRQEI
mmetsp:Transcript_58016/g.136245  ORF Transcript_58016/g.136245 Transcript_58016/m.136245 type:complete len:253 (-) Transcript_58016:1963-2721(-)